MTEILIPAGPLADYLTASLGFWVELPKPEEEQRWEDDGGALNVHNETWTLAADGAYRNIEEEAP